MKPVEDLENLLAHLLPRERVLVATDNSWLHRCWLGIVKDMSCIINFSGKIKGIAETQENLEYHQTKTRLLRRRV
jgi:hypothetical protein